MVFPSTPRHSSLASSSQPKHIYVGTIEQRDETDTLIATKRVYADHEIMIGRDQTRCQYVVDDPVVSKKHLRIYTVIYDKESPSEIPPLVYAEDLSRNGTYWNGSLIGKEDGGFLLGNNDTLRISARIKFIFRREPVESEGQHFDVVQDYEMKRFSEKYLLTNRLLGAGAFGKVFMAIEQTTRTQLACKVIDIRQLRPKSRNYFGRFDNPAPAEDVDSRVQLRKVKAWADQQQRDSELEEKLKAYYREAEVLSSVSHPNIIRLEKVYVTSDTIYMFQDLAAAGDLFSYLEHKNGKLLEIEAAVIVRQIIIALDYLHDKNIVHRDLKPENILMTTLSTGCRVILTDFGAARVIGNGRERMESSVGTVEYSAPEVLGFYKSSGAKRGYTRAVDMWSLGCVTVRLLTGCSAFKDAESDQFSESLAKNCSLEVLEKSWEWQNIRQRPQNFVRKLLVADEQERLTAKGALQDPWFSNEVHKDNFEELYRRTIRHWRPRAMKVPVIEFDDNVNFKRLGISSNKARAPKRHRSSGETPIEPPYIPFPRNFYSPFFPDRPSRDGSMSDEVKVAIEKNWGGPTEENLSLATSRLNSGPGSARRKGLSVLSSIGKNRKRSTKKRLSTETPKQTSSSESARIKSVLVSSSPGSSSDGGNIQNSSPIQKSKPKSNSRKKLIKLAELPKRENKNKTISSSNEILERAQPDQVATTPKQVLTKGIPLNDPKRAFSPSAWNEEEIREKDSSLEDAVLELAYQSHRKPGRGSNILPLRPITGEYVKQSSSRSKNEDRVGKPGTTITVQNVSRVEDLSAEIEKSTRIVVDLSSDLEAGSLTDQRSDQENSDTSSELRGSKLRTKLSTPTKNSYQLKLKTLSPLVRYQDNPAANIQKRWRNSLYELDEDEDTDTDASRPDTKKQKTS